jgi:hypothetical protein
MPASDLQTVYRFRESIETAARDYLYSGLVNSACNISVRRDMEQVLLPQISIKLSIQGTENQKFICPDGLERFNTFNGMLSFEPVTYRKDEPAKGIDHEGIEAIIRALIGQWGNGNQSRFPIMLQYHVILYMQDADNNFGIDRDNALDITTINYAIKFAIRNDAWPTVIPIPTFILTDSQNNPLTDSEGNLLVV